MFDTECTEVQIAIGLYIGVPESVVVRVLWIGMAIGACAQLLRHKLKDSPILSYCIVGTPHSFSGIRVGGTIDKGPQYCFWRRIPACFVDHDGGMSVTIKQVRSRHQSLFRA